MKEEEIKGITEETTQELLDAFDNFIKTSEEIARKTHNLISHAMKDAIQCATLRFLAYCERYVNATFLTRWYWLRKAKKMPQVLREMEKMYNEHEHTMYKQL